MEKKNQQSVREEFEDTMRDIGMVFVYVFVAVFLIALSPFTLLNALAVWIDDWRRGIR